MISRLFSFLAIILLVTIANAAPRKTEIDGAAGKLSILFDIPPARETVKGPVVILCHGFTSWKGEPLLVAVAEAATKAGFPVVCFDFNGHGESGGDFSKMTVSSEVDDLRRVMEWIAKQPWGGDFLLVGHSQGGVVVGMACGLYDNIKGAVLLAPAGILVDDSKSGRIFDARIDPANPPETIPLSAARNYSVDALCGMPKNCRSMKPLPRPAHAASVPSASFMAVLTASSHIHTESVSPTRPLPPPSLAKRNSISSTEPTTVSLAARKKSQTSPYSC